MSTALISVSVTKVGTTTRSTTLLISKSRVVDYRQNADGVCEVRYYTGVKSKPIKLVLTITKNAFTTLMQEAAVNDTVEVTVSKYNPFKTLFGQKNWRDPIATRERFSLDYWVWAEAYASDTTKSVITMNNADFGYLKYLVPYVLTDLDSTGSKSGSLNN